MTTEERPWRPGPGVVEAQRIFTQCIAMPRSERTYRLQDIFVKLHDLNAGLRREQELAILHAMDALP